MEGKVAGPAIGLIVMGLLGALLRLPGYFAGMIDPALFEEFGAQLPPEVREHIDFDAILSEATSVGSMVWNTTLVLLNLFIVWAGVRMLSRKSWTPAIVASALVMVTCLFQCCCCPIGVAVGVWSLIVLLDSNVKQAFEAKAAA